MRAVPARLLAVLPLVLIVLGQALPALGQSDEVVVIGASLEPAQLKVAPGTTVTWRNADDERHRMRSRTGPERFDSGNLEPGETFAFTFATPGTYPYLDERDDENAAYMGTIVVSGAGGTTPDAATAGPLAAAASVSLIDDSFQPSTIEIAAGGTVTWHNIDGDDSHTVTSSEGDFDSGILEGGASFAETFATPGTYPYTCLIHPEMQGTVIVSASDAGAPAGSTTPSIVPAASTTPSIVPAASAAPSSGPSAPAIPADSPPSAATEEVALAGRAFSPSGVTVPVGSTVRWLNDDGEGHTVSTLDGAFDSGILTVGAAFEHTFSAPGTFDYFCAIHPEMQGTVTVTE
jgi:plastocyanin